MLGKQVKSGTRQLAENLILEKTDRDGFISIKDIQSKRCQSLIRKVLKQWGYLPVHNTSSNLSGWQIAHMIKP